MGERERKGFRAIPLTNTFPHLIERPEMIHRTTLEIVNRCQICIANVTPGPHEHHNYTWSCSCNARGTGKSVEVIAKAASDHILANLPFITDNQSGDYETVPPYGHQARCTLPNGHTGPCDGE